MCVSNACFVYMFISSGPLVDETDITIPCDVSVSCTLWHPIFVLHSSVAGVRKNKAKFGVIAESWRPTQMARRPSLGAPRGYENLHKSNGIIRSEPEKTEVDNRTQRLAIMLFSKYDIMLVYMQ